MVIIPRYYDPDRFNLNERRAFAGFGMVERFNVFAPVCFNAALGVYLFRGFEGTRG